MSEKNEVIVRFPPSPTGFLHVGNVRTALYNYLFARQNKGKFIIRIEDTDKARSKKEYEQNMFECMKWLKLEHDNPGNEWRQTERTEVYKKYLNLLIQSGFAYISKETEGENKEVVRFKNPGGKIKFTDLIRGEVEIDVGDLGDFIIARNINEPVYHLAVVVDDMESNITHIIRGDDHISNTPRHILIWKAISEITGKEFIMPIYAHLPMILAEDKSKLSKRKHGESVSLNFYKEKGYEPEAILNFLALIGWNPGTDKEVFSLQELVEKFDLSKVQKKGGIFNIAKLNWINKQHILQMEDSKKFSIFHSQFLLSKWKNHEKSKDENFLKKLMKIMIDRIHRWGEVREILEAGEFDYLFEKPILQKEKISWKETSDQKTKENMEKVISIFKEEIENKDVEKINSKIMTLAEQVGKGETLWPIRYALSGAEKSPDPFSLIDILGEKESLDRLIIALEIL
jgi:glutamyl-tRNA synthetase